MRTEENHSPDWEKIKAEYLAGIKPIRAIARDHGISDTAIRKRAKEKGWGARPQPSSQPRELVVSTPRTIPDPPPQATPRSTVAVAIERASEIDPEELAKEGLVVLQMLLAEIKAEGVNIGWLESVIEEETTDDKSPRRYSALMKAVSAPVRALAAKNIVLAIQTASALGPGKKQQAKEKAATAGTGRFATPTAPPLFRSSTSMQ